MEIILGGVNDRILREREHMAWLAWHTAVIGRQEKIVPLKKLMPARAKKKAEPPKPDAWKRQYAAFAAWAGSFKKD